MFIFWYLKLLFLISRIIILDIRNTYRFLDIQNSFLDITNNYSDIWKTHTHTHSNLSPTCWPLSPCITHSLFHTMLKTHLFHKSSPPQSASIHLDCLLELYWTRLILLNGISSIVIFLSFYFGSCGRLSWLNCELSTASW